VILVVSKFFEKILPIQKNSNFIIINYHVNIHSEQIIIAKKTKQLQTDVYILIMSFEDIPQNK
jgi:hypothetical protein